MRSGSLAGIHQRPGKDSGHRTPSREARRVVGIMNRQRDREIDRTLFRRIARSLVEETFGRKDYELGIHFVGAAEMARLNETYLRHEGPTDVITFNHKEGADAAWMHGEIFICVEEAVDQARRFGVPLQSEIARYLVHGLLHLEGYDDAGPGPRRVMKRRENHLLNSLSRRFDLGRLGRHKRSAGTHERR